MALNISRLFVRSDGNVGIGTTSPDHILHVSGGAVCLDDASGSCGSLTLGTGDLYVTGSATTTKSLTVGTSTLFVHPSEYNVGIGTTNPTSTLQVVGTFHAMGPSGAEGLYYDEINNRVGIGTTAPGYHLDISPNAGGTLNIGNVGQTGQLTFGKSSYIYYGGDEFRHWTRQLNGITFYTHGTTPVERMRIAADGNVGIGTTTPGGTYGEVLTLIGSAYLTGSATTSQSLYVGDKLRVNNELIVAGNTTLVGATSTNLAVTSLNAASCDLKASTAGDIYCGSDATGASAGAAWEEAFTAGSIIITPTTTNAGIYVIGSSTFHTILRVPGEFNASTTNLDVLTVNTTASSTTGLYTQGNAHIGGNLTVDGASTLIIDATGNLTTAGYASSTTGLFTQGNLHAGGDATFDGRATTTGQFWVEGERTVGWKDPSFLVASSTLAYYGSYSATGSTTLDVGVAVDDETWFTIYCHTDTGTTTFALVGSSEYFECPRYQADAIASNTFTPTTNNTWATGIKREIIFGHSDGSPNQISITIKKRILAD